jgi:hypothetical protein
MSRRVLAIKADVLRPMLLKGVPLAHSTNANLGRIQWMLRYAIFDPNQGIVASV